MFLVKTQNYTCILPLFPAHTLRPVRASFRLPHATFPMSSIGMMLSVLQNSTFPRRYRWRLKITNKFYFFWRIPNEEAELRIKFYFFESFLVKTRNYACIFLLFPTHAPRPMPSSSRRAQLSHERYQHDAPDSAKFYFFEALLVKTQNYA